MSASKGLKSPIRHANDSYTSPDWAVKRFFERYPFPKGMACFDPCASRGGLIQAAASVRPDLLWIANELDSACLDDLKKVVPHATVGDFLKIPAPGVPLDMVIPSNPPYCLAEEFIEHGLKIAKIGAWLLRLNFFAGGRNEFQQHHNPGVFILPNRPSFNGWGGDACEYGWFVYGDPEVAGRIQYLDETPDAEIKAWNAAARKMYPEDNPKLKRARKTQGKEPFSSDDFGASLFEQGRVV
jgi:hypothetical protein